MATHIDTSTWKMDWKTSNLKFFSKSIIEMQNK